MQAEEKLNGMMPEAYDALHRIAAAQLGRERANHTLTPTALINEAYLRIAGQSNNDFAGQTDFCVAFAATSRRVLVDYARSRNCEKRGGRDRQRVPLDTSLLFDNEIPVDILDLDEALRVLEDVSPERAQVVELRYFGGLTENEVAERLDVSRTSVQKLWRGARAWLRAQLSHA